MRPDAVFKAYDVRGRTDNGELDATIFELIGSAFSTLLEGETIAVGRDCRSTSPVFFEALSSGATTAGSDIVDLGEVPTDLVYYYSGAHGVAGAMITASHNPPVYNGLKLCRPGASPIGAETGLEALKDLVKLGSVTVSEVRGSVRRVDAVDDYVAHLLTVVDPGAIGVLDVAVDGGNGMAGVAVQRVFDKLDAKLTGIYLEPDGTFPNHPADPLVPENLADLEELVGAGGFDIGVAFDGDADRAFFLDDRGSPLSGSTVTSLIARHLLTLSPGETVVHNVITSKAVPEIVRELGGTPVRTRVGHSFIKQVMAETGAIFGGEHSGHYYFRDNYRADSGMLAMLMLLAILTADDRPLSEIRGDVERYPASGEINFTVANQARALHAIEGSVYNASIDHMDGLTVDYGDEWFNLRPSNTEPLLRLNVEGPTPERVAAIVDRVSKMLGGTWVS